MMPSKSKAPNYPKSHLLAASGVAALLSLALLVFPSREVEAKKTFIDLKLESSSGQIVVEPGDSQPGLVESPFAATATPGTSSEAKNAELPEEEEFTQAPAPKSDSLRSPAQKRQRPLEGTSVAKPRSPAIFPCHGAARAWAKSV